MWGDGERQRETARDSERRGSPRRQQLLSTLPPASSIIQAQFLLPTQVRLWSRSRAGMLLQELHKVDVFRMLSQSNDSP